MSFLDGKSVLVTGATGSFGKRFIRTGLEQHRPARLIAFSRDELKQFEMQQYLTAPNLRYFLGDVLPETFQYSRDTRMTREQLAALLAHEVIEL